MQSEYRNSNNQKITIFWDLGEVMEIHDHEKHYAVTGKGTDQVDYMGTAIYIDGQFDEIVCIEEA